MAKKTTDFEPATKHLLHEDLRIFQRKLTEAEKLEHRAKFHECELEIEKWKNEAESAKKFVLAELAATDPVRIRAKENESKRRSQLHVVEKKRAELMREYHLHAAADGYIWVDVMCEVWADDVEQQVYSVRTDTLEKLYERRMTEEELKARAKRLQLPLVERPSPN